MSDPVIALVEDNPDDVALTLRAFNQSQVLSQVVVTNDGAQALDYIFATGRHADLDSRGLLRVILLDLKLPRIEGLEVLRRLWADERTKLLPVVVLTSSNEDQDLIRSYTFGANSYGRKPLDFDQFAEAIHQLGSYWLGLNEPIPKIRRV